jgi:hypothetical protein
MAMAALAGGGMPWAPLLVVALLLPALNHLASPQRRSGATGLFVSPRDSLLLAVTSGLFALAVWLIDGAAARAELGHAGAAGLWAATFVLTTCGRPPVRRLARRFGEAERWVVVGSDGSTAELRRLVAAREGISIVGVIDPRTAAAGNGNGNGGAAPNRVELLSLLQNRAADRVVLAPEAVSSDVIWTFMALGARVDLLTEALERLTGPSRAPRSIRSNGNVARANERFPAWAAPDGNGAPATNGAVPGSVRVSVVIPALNEAENLPLVLGRLPDGLHEVILVDGRSNDRTVQVARDAYPGIRVLAQSGCGKGDALRTGFAAVTGDIVVMLDADGSADPAEIPRFVSPLLAGSDFAKGSRFLPGAGSTDITRIRRLGNRGLTRTVNLLFETRYTDLCYGYNAFWTYCLPYIALDAPGFEVETVINLRIARARLRVVEVPSFEAERMYGRSNLHAFRDGTRVLRTILAEWLARPASTSDGALTSSNGTSPTTKLPAANA